jgi:hypothetical protein
MVIIPHVPVYHVIKYKYWSFTLTKSYIIFYLLEAV